MFEPASIDYDEYSERKKAWQEGPEIEYRRPKHHNASPHKAQRDRAKKNRARIAKQKQRRKGK